jgi:hypothetical protein
MDVACDFWLSCKEISTEVVASVATRPLAAREFFDVVMNNPSIRGPPNEQADSL